MPYPSQSKVIAAVAETLVGAGWKVAYTCMPGRAHVGVVPIPSAFGSGRQRYPDIVSTDGRAVRLSEIEPRLSSDVLDEITARFIDHCRALQVPETYRIWSEAVLRSTGVALPEEFEPLCELIVIQPPTEHFKLDVIFPDDRAFTIELAEQYSPLRH